MHSFHSAFVSRGIAVASSHAFSSDSNGDEEVKVPAFFMLVVTLTILGMMGALFAVSSLQQASEAY